MFNGNHSNVVLGPTLNITINEVIPPDYIPPFKPIFEPDITLLLSQNVTMKFDSYYFLIDLSKNKTGFEHFKLPKAVSPTDLSMQVTVSPIIFDSFITFDASAKTFLFDLDILNITSYVWS